MTSLLLSFLAGAAAAAAQALPAAAAAAPNPRNPFREAMTRNIYLTRNYYIGAYHYIQVCVCVCVQSSIMLRVLGFMKVLTRNHKQETD
jgi:hypothetical protein